MRERMTGLPLWRRDRKNAMTGSGVSRGGGGGSAIPIRMMTRWWRPGGRYQARSSELSGKGAAGDPH